MPLIGNHRGVGEIKSGSGEGIEIDHIYPALLLSARESRDSGSNRRSTTVVVGALVITPESAGCQDPNRIKMPRRSDSGGSFQSVPEIDPGTGKRQLDEHEGA